MTINWQKAPPPKGPNSACGLLAPKPGDDMKVVILGGLVGLETHWVNGRTIPCTGSKECRVHYEPITWKGFAPVLAEGWTWRGKTPGHHQGVLVVTEEIGEQVAAMARGCVIIVTRKGPKHNSPLSFKMLAPWKDALALPPHFDVKPFVLRATGLGVHCPLKLRRAE